MNVLGTPDIRKMLSEHKAKCRAIHKKYKAFIKTKRTNPRKKIFLNAVEAADWLADHPMFWDKEFISRHLECFDWQLVLVSSMTLKIENDPKRNTHLRCWLECGEYFYETHIIDGKRITQGMPCHDVRLDVGDDSFEKAIIKLAAKVCKYYGDYDRWK